jgi:hypothetical protein
MFGRHIAVSFGIYRIVIPVDSEWNVNVLDNYKSPSKIWRDPRDLQQGPLGRLYVSQ